MKSPRKRTVPEWLVPVQGVTLAPVTTPQDHTAEPAAEQRDGRGPLRSAVIVNPNRVEGLDELRDGIVAQLTEAGWPEPTWLETTAEDPGTGQAKQAVADGAEVVFVAGGDGTVRACIDGLAGTDTALAILPGGTGNLLATNLGVPTNTIEGVQLALDRGRRAVDLGEIEGQKFAVMAGMGLDAAMVDDAPTKLKAVLGPVAYVFSALKHLNDAEMKVEVQVDSYPVLRRRARSVIVGNVGRLQGGVNLLPDAEPDNGQMDVAVLPRATSATGSRPSSACSARAQQGPQHGGAARVAHHHHVRPPAAPPAGRRRHRAVVDPRGDRAPRRPVGVRLPAGRLRGPDRGLARRPSSLRDATVNSGGTGPPER